MGTIPYTIAITYIYIYTYFCVLVQLPWAHASSIGVFTAVLGRVSVQREILPLMNLKKLGW